MDATEKDVTTKLIASFKNLMSEGALVPGDRLPSEREQARRFGVSRSSLRQALKVLEIMGVVSQRVGDGTYVTSKAAAILGEPMELLMLLNGISHYELFEARLIVEPELAARAAERATLEDLASLRRSINAIKESERSRPETVEHDLAFHEGVFVAAGNRVCRMMFGVIVQAVMNSIARTSQLGDVPHTVDFHERIYSAIYNRQPEDARRTMREHLEDARDMLVRGHEAQEQRESGRKWSPAWSNSPYLSVRGPRATSGDDVTAKLIARFKDLMSDGALVPGSRLPSERDLARKFGVSRSSLRETMKVLVIMGVLVQRVGDGTYVSSEASSILSEPIDFLVQLNGISNHELFEVRQIVEPELAARAANRATVQDLATLRRAITAIQSLDPESDSYRRERIESDFAFHDAIFVAAGNRVCRLMFNVILRPTMASMARTITRMDLERVVAFHESIYSCIHRGAAEDAGREMRLHLTDARKSLVPKPALQNLIPLASRMTPIRQGTVIGG